MYSWFQMLVSTGANWLLLLQHLSTRWSICVHGFVSDAKSCLRAYLTAWLPIPIKAINLSCQCFGSKPKTHTSLYTDLMCLRFCFPFSDSFRKILNSPGFARKCSLNSTLKHDLLSFVVFIPLRHFSPSSSFPPSLCLSRGHLAFFFPLEF